MAFSQMMVAISLVEMRYFATPKSSKHFNPTFCFHWADENNKPVNKWETVVDKFLMVPMAHQMVGDYLVINEAEEKENQCHMLMRPYQVYALQSVELAAFGRDNKDGLSHGGYPKNIDLIIVADQMLTGYDDRYLNTLYVDHSLEL